MNVHNFDPLYALSKTGKLRIYTISVEDHEDYAVLVTASQLGEDGKCQEDRKKISCGVNIGKANETTYLEQAMRMANTKISKLHDQGFSEDRPAEDQKFNTDANGQIKPMLAIKFDEKQIKYPCLVQPKYDGVRCTISIGSDNEVKIISRQGKPYNIPHIASWSENHRSMLPLDGELYNHKELTFQEITSAVKKRSELTDKIHYVVYDKPVCDVDNSHRWCELLKYEWNDAFKESPVYLSDYKICNNMDEIREYHAECVANGYEGVIIRNLDGMYEFGFRSRNLIKLKDFDDAEFEIVDVLEGTGRDEGTAVFVLKIGDHQFKARPVGTLEQRTDYFVNRKMLIGKQCTVKYQGKSNEGIPRFPIAIAVRDYE